MQQLGRFDAIVPDLTGAATVGELADCVLRDAPPQFALAGFSLGGIVALEIVARAAQSRLAARADRDHGSAGSAGAGNGASGRLGMEPGTMRWTQWSRATSGRSTWPPPAWKIGRCGRPCWRWRAMLDGQDGSGSSRLL